MYIYSASKDVNDFLVEAATTKKVPDGYGDAILLFVDPYDAGTVHLESMVRFIRSRYCEVIYNWFSSDLTRNRNDTRIEACFDGLIAADGDVAGAIKEALCVNKMKCVFSYTFRTSTNTELYQIIFVTPNMKGLEKLKEALWDTFRGCSYHRNSREKNVTQPTLFDEKELKDDFASYYAAEARTLLCQSFSGRTNVPYGEISHFLLERTMLNESHVIKHVIKPLCDSKAIRKNNVKSKQDFKGDTYAFKQEE